MRFVIWSVLLLFVGLNRMAIAADLMIGTAVRTDDTLCLDIDRPGLQPGTPILLIAPTAPQRSSRAAIDGGSACPKRSHSPYVLHLLQGRVAENLIMVAVVNGKARTGSRGQVVAVVPGVETLSFRSCTSSDGVHVTAWRGRPLRSERVWHAYVYLNMDLKPDCTSAETADGG